MAKINIMIVSSLIVITAFVYQLVAIYFLIILLQISYKFLFLILNLTFSWLKLEW